MTDSYKDKIKSDVLNKEEENQEHTKNYENTKIE
jgi:hypothetical protein